MEFPNTRIMIVNIILVILASFSEVMTQKELYQAFEENMRSEMELFNHTHNYQWLQYYKLYLEDMIRMCAEFRGQKEEYFTELTANEECFFGYTVGEGRTGTSRSSTRATHRRSGQSSSSGIPSAQGIMALIGNDSLPVELDPKRVMKNAPILQIIEERSKSSDTLISVDIIACYPDFEKTNENEFYLVKSPYLNEEVVLIEVEENNCNFKNQ